MGYSATIRRAYADFRMSHLEPWNEALSKFSFVKVSAPSFVKGKGTSDMAMIIGAMDMLRDLSDIECFVLVTSDSDFTPLARRLKQAGKEIVGFGERKTPLALVQEYKNFFYVDTFKGKTISTIIPKRNEVPKRKAVTVEENTAAANAVEAATLEDNENAFENKTKSKTKRKRNEDQQSDEVVLDVVDNQKKGKIVPVQKHNGDQRLIKALVEVINQNSNEYGWASLSSIGQNFDRKRHGYPKISKCFKRNRNHFLLEKDKVRVRVQNLILPDDELGKINNPIELD
ncbi:unnamed protein product [Cylindrotheca closterium]|uniref:NYN domain-containing protein n=1 Tax=Cylindrotheca closterium TaxID=2856 RepID=A0AAD2PY12_9STRA|nr:unnamed protein product [Cylindrotheca closterium]